MSSNNFTFSQVTQKSGGNRYKFTSFWQSSYWTEILFRTHYASEVFSCEVNGQSMLVERRKIIGKYTALYALGVDIAHISSELIEGIKSHIAQKTDLFLQIEPLGKEKDIVELHRHSSFNYGNKAPFRRFLETHTAVLNLENQTEESLLRSFHEKGRYNIRLAEKRGVTISWVSGKAEQVKGKSYTEAFYELLKETTERDGFSHNSLKYYQEFLSVCEENNLGGLLIAEKDGILHAAGIFVFLPTEGIYYYGASSSDSNIRRDMATYLLQWEAIREALRRGCRTYDFLGISADGKGKLSGVTEFKMRFNPEKVCLPKEIVIIYRPILLKILQWIRLLRGLIR